MARNKDFFVNSTPKRDRSFFVKEDTTANRLNNLRAENTAPNVLQNTTVNGQDKFNSQLRAPVKQDLGDKIGNFFKVTLPNTAEDLWDDIKEPFTGPSTKQLMTEAKLSPTLLKEDAEIQLAKQDPTKEDYALVKQTKKAVEKYGLPTSNIKAMGGDNTQLLKDLERAEKTYQASPIDATFANIGAAGAGILSDAAGFANMLGGDKIPVIKDINNAIISTAEVLQENAQDYNVGTYGGYLGNLTQVITRMVPYFIAGTGKAAATGSKAALIAAKTIQNPSFWVSLITTAGQKYNENMNNGISRGTATLNALTTALPSALIEIGGGIGAQGKEAQSLLRTILEENLEEIAQGLVENISDKLTTKKDMPIYSTTEEAIINPKQMGEEILYTTPATLLTGGASRISQNIQNQRANKEIEDMRARYQIKQDLNNYKKTSPYHQYQEVKTNNTISSKDVKPRLMLPEGGKIYVNEDGVAIDSSNYVAPRSKDVFNNNYSVVNGRQVLSNPQNQSQTQNIEQPNVTLPTQTKMAQNANMWQIAQMPNLPTQKAQQTLQSAKLAGMTDMDMQKAIDLNNMLRSGASLEFYDAKNIPQGLNNEQQERAKEANGLFYNNTLWINKNSERPIQKILGHELTHYGETQDFINGILDSNLFYDFINEEGFANVSEYKKYLKEKKGYKDNELDSEMAAHFAEEVLFGNEKSINRLARENSTLTQKILNWLSDLRIKLVGTAQEKELLKIENMYRKALDQARNTASNTADVKYNIKNIAEFDETKYNNIQEMKLSPKEYGKLAHIVDTDPTIKPGLNRVTTSDATYVIYQKEYNDFKVVDKYEGGVDNDTIANGNIRGTDEARYGSRRLQVPIENTRNEGATKSNDELLNGNKGARSVKIESNRNGISDKKSVAGKEPAFSMPETDNQGRTLSKEQQEFFKDSKVRDENGKLKTTYHGTEANVNIPKEYWFTIFDIDKSDNHGNMLGDGFYFTEDKEHAKNYARDKGNIYETYLNITNPLEITEDENGVEMLKKLKEEANKEHLYLRSYLKIKGYDGIHTGKVYVAFEPNQIKNVDNTNPTKNPDIRYSMNPVEVGKKATSTKALSRYAQTLQNKHEDIPEQINLIQKEVDNGNFTHEVIHDKRSLNYAQKYIEDNGFDDAVKHWDELIKRGKPVDKDELALGQMIYNVAVDNKDTRLVMKMASDLVQEYTEIGRNLQSATLLRKMTPDGRLYALERSVQKINQDLMQKFDNFENIQIPEELADKLLRSETQKDMDTAVEQIQEYIASKIPATWQEKLNSWRYLAMLGNPRTHIRNIVGNAVFIPAVEMKNKLAQVGEKFIPQEQRTKATLTKKDAKLLNYAENDFDKNQETIRGENKYDIKSGIQEKRTIYSTGVLEAARKGNFKLLEAEDTLFLKYRYKKAFAGALKARGITIEQLRENSPETVRKVNEIRSYAINEAQKATYRDASIVALMVSRGKRKLLNAANQSQGAAKLGYNLAYLGAEGVMPFAKTPINIVKRGIEYSPAGLLNGVKNAIFDVKSGKVTAAQAIDKIAAGATGTAIAGLGFFLASIGLVSGGEEEKDKEQALKKLKGNQDYALNIGNKSYTIDWSAPSSIPLFIGVELYNSITSEDESAYLNALSKMAEPVVEMSMLQGLNDTLTTLGEDSAIGNIVGKSIMNYLGQYNPTLLGQIARTFDPVRRAIYVDKNIPVPAAAQKFIQQQAAKIPGVSRVLPTYKDQFGQEQLTDGVINRIVQNFFSPGYLKDIKEGTVEQGLTELYEKTGETSVIPSYASKTLTQNGEKINLTAKQYDTYAKTRGDISKKGLEGLFKDNYYKNMTDEQKVKIVEAIYDYANNVAKTKILDDFELEFNDKKIQKLQNEGLDFYKYILLKKTADADGNDYTSNDELDKAIKKYGLSRWQKTIKMK